MPAKLALELAQGALLGSKALTVKDIQTRVAGCYPAAQELPGRPELDELVRALDIGFQWNGSFEFANGDRWLLPAKRRDDQLRISRFYSLQSDSTRRRRHLHTQVG